MSAAPNWYLVSVQDYLSGEMISPIKHEYVGGVVYAMAGAPNVHNIIKNNTLATLHFRLRGRRCRPFDSDTKVRIELPHQIRFYYPDVSAVCEQNPQLDSFQYLTIPSLRVYALVEQESPAIIVFRRTATGFIREVFEGLAAVLPLSEIETELPLADVYDGVEFSTEPDDEELR